MYYELTNSPEGAGRAVEATTVVIPAFNEERTIREVVLGVKSHVPHARVLVIDDGSTDTTAQTARDAGAEVISHPVNKGNGAAVKTALRAISAGRVAVIDGDGQHNPEDLPKLLERLDEFDLVVGARSFGSGEGGLLRNLGNIFLGRLASFLAEQNIPDLTSGFRAFRHSVAKRFLHVYPNRYSFPSTTTLSFVTAGYNVGFVPVNARSRPRGTSSKLRPFRDGFRFLMFILRVITMANPNKIFFPVGLALVAAGIVLTIRNLMLFAQFSGGVVLFLAGGTNIIFFGLILDQFATLRLKERE
ncbi:MAG: glycosyltransferase family 2 protein [Deltaproteobacteria bacterium]|nr:glycosyltransferase family 2 protein [Deltaproteobacteria bacterium]